MELVNKIAKKNAELEDFYNDKRKVKKDINKEHESEVRKELRQERKDLNVRIREIRKAQAARQNVLQKLKNRISKTINKIRQRKNPRIINLNLDFRAMSTQGGIDKVIGHYTAGPRDKDTKDAIRLCKVYHQMHLNNGWSGEGYMLCFTVDGNILVLRPAKYVGAHTLGYNTGSYGIMMHGTTGDKPSDAQLEAIKWWAKNGNKTIMGEGKTIVRPKNLKWYGHNDFNATSCPGEFKNAYVSKGNKK